MDGTFCYFPTDSDILCYLGSESMLAAALPFGNQQKDNQGTTGGHEEEEKDDKVWRLLAPDNRRTSCGDHFWQPRPSWHQEDKWRRRRDKRKTRGARRGREEDNGATRRRQEVWRPTGWQPRPSGGKGKGEQEDHARTQRAPARPEAVASPGGIKRPNAGKQLHTRKPPPVVLFLRGCLVRKSCQAVPASPLPFLSQSFRPCPPHVLLLPACSPSSSVHWPRLLAYLLSCSSCPLFLFSWFSYALLLLCSLIPSGCPVVVLSRCRVAACPFWCCWCVHVVSVPCPFLLCCPPHAFLWSFCCPADVALLTLLSEAGAGAAAARHNNNNNNNNNNNDISGIVMPINSLTENGWPKARSRELARPLSCLGKAGPTVAATLVGRGRTSLISDWMKGWRVFIQIQPFPGRFF